LDGPLAVPPSDWYSDADKTSRTSSSTGLGQKNRTHSHQASAALARNPLERSISGTEASSSHKRVQASDSDNNDDVVPTTTTTITTATTTRKRSLASSADLPRKRVKQQSPGKNIHFSAEMMFRILDFCSDGTLLNFARTSKAYKTIIQPRMIKRALETPYNEDFGAKYPGLHFHERRCPLICAIFNENERLLNVLVEKKYFPVDGLFLCAGRSFMTPLHWAIECEEYREQQYTGGIKKLLEVGFLPNIHNYRGYAPLHILMRQTSVGEREGMMWHRPIIDMLMQHGAEVDLETETYYDSSTERTPLLIACFCNQNQSIIGALLEHGAMAILSWCLWL
jgi:hypothetical protein